MRQITLVLLITLASSALADEWLLETSDAEILGQGKIIHIEKMNEFRRFEILVSHKGITWWCAVDGFEPSKPYSSCTPIITNHMQYNAEDLWRLKE